METTVGSFAIPGATLAQILHDFGSGESDCDGILFGRLQTQVTSSICDDHLGPPTLLEQTTARVTGHFCTGRVMSFYDSIGRLNQSKLASILKDRQTRGEDPPIGWYMGRRNSPLWPSMRETAVTASLRAAFKMPTLEQPSSLRALAMAGSAQKKKLSTDGQSPVDGRGDDRSGSPSSTDSKTLQSEAFGGSPSISRRVQSMPRSEGYSPRSPGRTASYASQVGTDPGSGHSPSGYQERRSESRFSGPSAPAPAPSPCFFVLFTDSDSANHAVKTLEYRAFQSLQNSVGIGFQPLPVKIVNAGLSYRGYYDSFVPVARFPLFQGDSASSPSDRIESESPRSPHRGKSIESTSPRREVGRQSYARPTQELNGKQERSSRRSHDDPVDPRYDALSGEQALNSIYARGMRVSEFEKMYQVMLSKLERLATEVCDSSAALNQASR
ncbi:hypothetical protein R1flu_001402 [Riccia fluitans]|uniref:Uncharacterized protein n=1 Tax=Riccia fluitans TaxID=41844 RepID=A0ABD1Y6E9_9MARC